MNTPLTATQTETLNERAARMAQGQPKYMPAPAGYTYKGSEMIANPYDRAGGGAKFIHHYELTASHN